MTTEGTNNFAEKLAVWYHKHKRDLPWRNTQDPYLIWMSEIILQQTRVKQGLPYFEKFAENYPTVFDLAKAHEEEVLRLWQGLGYYSRARNMHATAQHIVNQLNGQFPNTFKELLKLKGVGNYTAAAIASFAFKEKVASVDGNVYRVLSRVFGIDADISDGKGRKVFEETANELIPESFPDIFNQALMEFGATHCTPKSPNCLHCPFSQECEARLTGKQSELPVKTKKVKVKKRFFHYLVFEHDGQWLVKQRKQKDIWSGLFDFYLIEKNKFYTFELLQDSIQDVLASEGINGKDFVTNTSKTYTHILTHQKLEICFYRLIFKEEHFLEKLKNSLSMSAVDKDGLDKIPKPILIDNYLKEYIY